MERNDMVEVTGLRLGTRSQNVISRGLEKLRRDWVDRLKTVSSKDRDEVDRIADNGKVVSMPGLRGERSYITPLSAPLHPLPNRLDRSLYVHSVEDSQTFSQVSIAETVRGDVLRHGVKTVPLRRVCGSPGEGVSRVG